MRGNAEFKISISGGKKWKNNNNDVAMKTNSNCKYLYILIFFDLLFFFWFFFGTRERFSLLSVSVYYCQC